MRQHVVVSGIPASGKSSLGRSISEALSLAMLDKDDILEDLFNKQGIGDASWRTTLSRAADEILREQALQAQGSVIVSWWRHPASMSASGTPVEWLSELQGVLIEVHCICDPEVALARFMSRTRDSGHLDHLKVSSDVRRQFEEHATLGPLGLGRLVEVNTEGDVELAEVLDQIKRIASSY